MSLKDSIARQEALIGGIKPKPIERENDAEMWVFPARGLTDRHGKPFEMRDEQANVLFVEDHAQFLHLPRAIALRTTNTGPR